MSLNPSINQSANSQPDPTPHADQSAVSLPDQDENVEPHSNRTGRKGFRNEVERTIRKRARNQGMEYTSQW